MKHEIINMSYRHDEIRFDMRTLPDHITADAYMGLYQELYIRMFEDFFEFDNDDDRRDVPFSLLSDMHHLIDVYQLQKKTFVGAMKKLDIDIVPFRVHLSYDDDYNLTIDFDNAIGAPEVFFAMIVLIGETLDEMAVSEMICNINFELIDLQKNEVIN